MKKRRPSPLLRGGLMILSIGAVTLLWPRLEPAAVALLQKAALFTTVLDMPTGALETLREKGLVLHRPYVGRYACSMEMQGMSLSLMKLDDELKRLLDAPADSPFFKQF